MDIRNKFKEQKWNIAFCNATPKDVVMNKITYSDFIWLKHPYKDRIFADPFILNTTPEYIEVLVEELPFKRGIAYLSKLKIDAANYELLDKKIILKESTHLSYPNIIRYNDEIFILPENKASNSLKIYQYNKKEEKCHYFRTLLNEGISDPNIIEDNGHFLLFGTKGSDCHLYLWESIQLTDGYKPENGKLIKNDKKGSRMAGSFFEFNYTLYRPAQDCTSHYGQGLIIQQIKNLSFHNYQEKEISAIYPTKEAYYNRGTHTLNFLNGLCVIDGYCLETDYINNIRHRLGHKYHSYKNK